MSKTASTKRANIARAGRTDGRLFPVLREDVIPGAVLRMVTPSDGSVPAFSDLLVIRVAPAVDEGEVPSVVLARPYAYVSSTGALLTGSESLTVPMSRLTAEDSPFSSVVQSTGLVATHGI